MATRPSTAEILAAARAADGKVSAVSQSAHAATPTAHDANAPTGTKDSRANGVSPAAAEHAPPQIKTILREVQGEREQTTPTVVAPPSVQTMLQAVCGNEDDDVGVSRPASVAAMLAEVRRICGTTEKTPPHSVPTPTPPIADRTTASQSARSKPGRLSTAEILAAARQQGSSASNGKPSSPVPACSSAGTTQDILAAARRQGAATGAQPSGTGTRSKPKASQPVAVAASTPGVKEPTTEVADDGRSRPPSMSDVLSRVREETQRRAASVNYPSISEMMRAMRDVDRRTSDRLVRRPDRNGWISKMKRWFADAPDTHQGASI
jgi:hypothetical protein